jgi:hypothetical protein
VKRVQSKPRLRFIYEHEGVYTILTAHNLQDREVGYFELQRIRIGRDKYTKVAYAEVLHPGKGIGTKMYEAASRYACRQKAPLASGKLRTRFSQGFWTKQLVKGRSSCVVKRGGVRLTDDFAFKGRWSCGQFALPCPAPKSLAGTHR